MGGRCACENPGHGTFASCTSSRNCNCNGRVRMGYGNRWTSWRDVSGSIQCTNGAFGGDPAPGQAKECQCDGYELLRSGSCPANRQSANLTALQQRGPWVPTETPWMVEHLAGLMDVLQAARSMSGAMWSGGDKVITRIVAA